mmetsp:Transcript_53290/g.158959  ORF Transcript_53290/g.158959 Transcript_53290/m.158959 type:complete len:298 (+) Transcript_53290:920-1813(+)
MSTKTPNGIIFVTRPSLMGSPALKSAGPGRVETESRLFTGSDSVILRPEILSPALKSLRGLGSWFVGQSASREAPTLRKTPNDIVRVTVPSTSMPTVNSPKSVPSSASAASAAAAMFSRRPTSKLPAMTSTLMIIIPLISSPTWYSLAGFGRNLALSRASLDTPMSMRSPLCSTAATLPETIEPRTSCIRSEFVVTVTRWPSTFSTIRSATSPLEYSSGSLLSKRLGARTSWDKPASKNIPKSPTVITVPSSRSPSLTSDGMRRGETSTCSFCTLTDTTLRPETESPTEYSVRGFSN